MLLILAPQSLHHHLAHRYPAEPSLLTNTCEGINNTCQCGKLNLMEILRLFTLEKIDWDISNGQRFNFKENNEDIKNTLL